MNSPAILNLGSGADSSIPDAISVDISPLCRPNILCNLAQFPWPFRANSFDVIYCKDILEHLPDIVKTMEEIHRVAKPGARVHITTPHFSCANSYTDPTHLHHLGLNSFDFLTGERPPVYYTSVRFKKIRRQLFFYPKWKNKVLWRIAKRWPDFYEEHLAWVFPAWFIYLELEAVK